MIYNPKIEEDVMKARERLESLVERGEPFEIVSRRQMVRRSTRQNDYLHVCIAYFAAETGYDTGWVKEQYYKRHCNPDLYVRQGVDLLLGDYEFLRSSADLTTEEMSLSLARFKYRAATEAGVTLPDRTEEEMLEAWKVIKGVEEYL